MDSITVGTKLRIEKGCKARSVTKGSTAVVKLVTELGPEYNHNVRITIMFLNSFLSGKVLSFYAQHPNRLGDDVINLNDGIPEHKIKVRKL